MDFIEKARAIAHEYSAFAGGLPMMKRLLADAIAAAMKDVADEAVKHHAESCDMDILVANKELTSKLAAFTCATPDSPEVKEALSVVDGSLCKACMAGPTQSVTERREHSEYLDAGKVLTRALRVAQVRIKELEGTSAGIFQLEAVAAQAKLAEAEAKIKELEDIINRLAFPQGTKP